MAETAPARPGLIGLLALAPAVALATMSVPGPWEPVSVAVGWTAVVLLAGGIVAGYPSPIAVGTALLVARTGIHGLAGDRFPGLAISTVLILATVEMASLSFESRRMPLDLPRAVARALAAAAGGGLIVGVAASILDGPQLEGAGYRLLGLALALVLGSTLVWSVGRAVRGRG